eukprot:56659-Eustigmatos_ZCMA.PRE.1
MGPGNGRNDGHIGDNQPPGITGNMETDRRQGPTASVVADGGKTTVGGDITSGGSSLWVLLEWPSAAASLGDPVLVKGPAALGRRLSDLCADARSQSKAFHPVLHAPPS